MKIFSGFQAKIKKYVTVVVIQRSIRTVQITLSHDLETRSGLKNNIILAFQEVLPLPSTSPIHPGN